MPASIHYPDRGKTDLGLVARQRLSPRAAIHQARPRNSGSRIDIDPFEADFRCVFATDLRIQGDTRSSCSNFARCGRARADDALRESVAAVLHLDVAREQAGRAQSSAVCATREFQVPQSGLVFALLVENGTERRPFLNEASSRPDPAEPSRAATRKSLFGPCRCVLVSAVALRLAETGATGSPHCAGDRRRRASISPRPTASCGGAATIRFDFTVVWSNGCCSGQIRNATVQPKGRRRDQPFPVAADPAAKASGGIFRSSGDRVRYGAHGRVLQKPSGCACRGDRRLPCSARGRQGRRAAFSHYPL